MITVVIPCYNAEPYLAEAIESVLSQTRLADEIIVVDDCSTDRSATVAAGYPVQVLRTAVNSGHSTARNLGIQAARGDLIAWLDADDYWEPTHLDVVAGLLDRFDEAAVAFSRVRYVGARQGEWPASPCDGQPRNVFWDCLERTVVPANTAITRRTSLLEVGGFNPAIRVAPDFDLWLRLSRRHPFVSSSSITANYRWHASQISAHNGERQFRSMYEARQRMRTTFVREHDAEMIRQIDTRLPELWDADLARAWKRGYMARMKYLLALEPLVGNCPTVRQRWLVRARVPAFALRTARGVVRRFKRLISAAW